MPRYNVLFSCLRLALIAYVLALAALYFFQDRLLLPSTSHVTDIEIGRHAGYEVQPWHPHGQYAGYVVVPDGREPLGTVLIYHGNAESAENKLPIADVFVSVGYRVVMVEYPGHGKRQGPRTMKAALTASREALVGARAQWSGPILLVGESLGAGMAAQAQVGQESVVSGVLLITPWDSLESVASEKLKLFPVRWILHDRFDTVTALKGFTGQLVVVGAAKDTVIPIWHAKRLTRLHQGAKFVLLPESGHDDWFNAMTAHRWREVFRCLQMK